MSPQHELMLSLNVEAGMFTRQSSLWDSQVPCHNVARIHSQPELGTQICKSDHDNCFSTVPPQQIYKNSCFFFLISILISYLPLTVAGKEHNTAPPSFVSFFLINVGFSFILQQSLPQIHSEDSERTAHQLEYNFRAWESQIYPKLFQNF